MSFLLTMRRAAALVALCGVALVACDPAAGPDASTLLPKTGMTVHAQTYALDMWGTVQKDSTGDRWFTMLEDTSSKAGRANIARIIMRADTFRNRGGDTNFFHIANNGDVSMLQTFPQAGLLQLPPRWVTFPIGTKGSKVTTVIDTAFVLGTRTYSFKETWRTSFMGSELIDTGRVQSLIKRGDLATLKSQVIQTVDSSQGFGLATPIVTTHTMWYSPELGMPVKFETIVTTPGPSGPTERIGGGTGWRIIGYRQR